MADDKHQGGAPRDESRRQFLKYSGAALGGVVAGGVIGGVIGRSMTGGPAIKPPGQRDQPEKQTKDYNQALMFLNTEQFLMTQAAAERIYPKDELGPGAIELGVAYYIDHQLAGPWGMNARDYMMGPFYKAEATQGYQSGFKRNEIITLGLQALKDYSEGKHGKAFTDLDEAQQDEVLTVFEKGEEVQLHGISSKLFFNLLRSLTIEGAYSDPLYGGNKNMDGWRMRNYPGNQMSYLDVIDKEEFIKMEPASLHDHMSH
ncbi:gluconate 2-dehydrogenase subunit 3 family protein [Paenibacillus sp. J2TS4]|uniref:gluconate 2-dehydrogenase subunit 3 family protein n=1 Tax=Paenibacillus sp. J2TS4 TaxID=2807194 RepID=UPI001B066F2C|nr:gluconate 2-dehydrogenase subunit 3 family protein [Paenibacillus sp. J2TS4]GIP31083.1 oxidoreductase [Paenibacillus sp. J2TS4]